MEPIRHGLPILIVALHGVFLFWLRKHSPSTEAKIEGGRITFPAVKESRFLVVLSLIALSTLAIASSYLLRRAGQWWVPYVFVGFLIIVPLLYPPALIIDADGIESRNWYGHEKKIRWEDIAGLHFHLGKKHFTLRAADGRTITHSRFNADQFLFIHEVRRRTRLSMMISRPWSNETIEIPYRQSTLE